jgi:hypothetical protein
MNYRGKSDPAIDTTSNVIREPREQGQPKRKEEITPEPAVRSDIEQAKGEDGGSSLPTSSPRTMFGLKSYLESQAALRKGDQQREDELAWFKSETAKYREWMERTKSTSLRRNWVTQYRRGDLRTDPAFLDGPWS